MKNNSIPDSQPLLKGWLRALLIIVPFFAVTIVFQRIGYSILGLDIMSRQPLTLAETAVLQCITVTGHLLLVFVFIRYIDRRSFMSLGLQLKGYAKDILPGIATGAIIMSLGFAVLLVLNGIEVTHIRFDACKLLTWTALFVLVALNEEIFCRGYVLYNFLQSTNRYPALIFSSMIFSILHIFNPDFDLMSFVSILLAGLLLGISYIYTKNLWFPVALHFSWNFFQGPVFGFNVSGTSVYSIINQHPEGNNILNGGEFGFEGSILSQIFIVIATVLIWRYVKKSRFQSS
ncbi:MAG: CPBP family intramembrane metalloprotease [Prevotellaceae bacterium]|jgi:membrane protease YdiL (CAAX protease family)|nr:CPBP family intramembrane metalloprotease [Prevotellaceae bacterium]